MQNIGHKTQIMYIKFHSEDIDRVKVAVKLRSNSSKKGGFRAPNCYEGYRPIRQISDMHFQIPSLPNMWPVLVELRSEHLRKKDRR